MTTPGAVRTKLWRSANKKRYNAYMSEYMKKKRAEKKVPDEVRAEGPKQE